MATTFNAAVVRRPDFGLAPWLSRTMLVGGTAIAFASTYAVLRALFGFAPMPAGAKDIAVVVHLATVIPSIPLGLVIFLSRKGNKQHRLLGRTWMALMVITAAAAFFIRHLNNGGFSYIHLFSVLTLIAIPSAILAAKQGRIAHHRRQLTALFIGALVVAGFFSFMPGRIMWTWMFA
jgi:uncharacterized membrane protein